jgi:phage gp36-like protein
LSYLETQDLIDELGESTLVQLTDDAGTGQINDARTQKAIEFARGTFDSYARSRYSIPVPVTPVVKSINLDLAIFHLYKSRSTIAEGVYTIRKNAYDDAMRQLKAIAEGRAALDVPATEEAIDTPATSDKVLSNAANAKFTDDRLKSF